MKISVVLPAYQEAENLKHILPELKEALLCITKETEILVVDTMTPMDETKDICLRYGCKYVTREGGNMYGDAIRTGFHKACGEYVVVMDADGSHHPEDIARFYQEMETGKYDLIIGSRYCEGGKTENGFVLRAMSRILNISYKIVFGLKVRDVSDSFRMYKGSQIKTIQTECENFDIVEEILILLSYTIPDFKAREVPICFDKRTSGNSKRDLGKFIKSYLVTMKRLLTIKNRVKGYLCDAETEKQVQ